MGLKKRLVILIFIGVLGCENIYASDVFDISLSDLAKASEEWMTEEETQEAQKSELGYRDTNVDILKKYVNDSAFEEVLEKLKEISKSAKNNLQFAIFSDKVARDGDKFYFHLTISPYHIYNVVLTEDELVEFNYLNWTVEDLKLYESKSITKESLNDISTLKVFFSEENWNKLLELGDEKDLKVVSYWANPSLLKKEIYIINVKNDKIYSCVLTGEGEVSMSISDVDMSLQEAWYEFNKVERESVD